MILAENWRLENLHTHVTCVLHVCGVISHLNGHSNCLALKPSIRMIFWSFSIARHVLFKAWVCAVFAMFSRANHILHLLWYVEVKASHVHNGCNAMFTYISLVLIRMQEQIVGCPCWLRGGGSAWRKMKQVPLLSSLHFCYLHYQRRKQDIKA